MIVCSCLGITDGEIRDAMRADREAMAGTCCGSCLPLVSDIARKLREDDSPSVDSDGAPPPTDFPPAGS